MMLVARKNKRTCPKNETSAIYKMPILRILPSKKDRNGTAITVQCCLLAKTIFSLGEVRRQDLSINSGTSYKSVIEHGLLS